MSEPLALLYYSNLMPGTQLASRLRDLGYRVQSLNDAGRLSETCEREKPLVVIAELAPPPEARAAIAQLKGNAATQHIPVLAYSATHDLAAQAKAREAGVTLLAANEGIADQLPQLLDQILQVE